jgi:hypothetical protein
VPAIVSEIVVVEGAALAKPDLAVVLLAFPLTVLAEGEADLLALGVGRVGVLLRIVVDAAAGKTARDDLGLPARNQGRGVLGRPEDLTGLAAFMYLLSVVPGKTLVQVVERVQDAVIAADFEAALEVIGANRRNDRLVVADLAVPEIHRHFAPDESVAERVGTADLLDRESKKAILASSWALRSALMAKSPC